MIRRIATFLFVSLILTACGDEDSRTDSTDDTSSVSSVPAPLNISFQVINQFPHDTSAFTEGFTFYQGKLYESTGSPDAPSNSGTWIAEVDLKTGKVDKKVDLGKTYFGEGIVFFN